MNLESWENKYDSSWSKHCDSASTQNLDLKEIQQLYRHKVLGKNFAFYTYQLDFRRSRFKTFGQSRLRFSQTKPLDLNVRFFHYLPSMLYLSMQQAFKLLEKKKYYINEQAHLLGANGLFCLIILSWGLYCQKSLTSQTSLKQVWQSYKMGIQSRLCLMWCQQNTQKLSFKGSRGLHWDNKNKWNQLS